jgi:hypothetical protein
MLQYLQNLPPDFVLAIRFAVAFVIVILFFGGLYCLIFPFRALRETRAFKVVDRLMGAVARLVRRIAWLLLLAALGAGYVSFFGARAAIIAISVTVLLVWIKGLFDSRSQTPTRRF